MTVLTVCLAIVLAALVLGVVTLRVAVRRVDSILAEELGPQVDAGKARIDQMS